MWLNEMTKIIQDLKTEFSKEVKILKKAKTELKMELKSSTQLENSPEQRNAVSVQWAG